MAAWHGGQLHKIHQEDADNITAWKTKSQKTAAAVGVAQQQVTAYTAHRNQALYCVSFWTKAKNLLC
jgi:hypothetical protein